MDALQPAGTIGYRLSVIGYALPLRMLDYSTRLSLTYRDIPIHSVVLYLGGAGARDTGQHALYGPTGQVRLSWYHAVVQIWQLEAETLLKLNRSALLALIGQTRIQQPQQTIPAGGGESGTGDERRAA